MKKIVGNEIVSLAPAVSVKEYKSQVRNSKKKFVMDWGQMNFGTGIMWLSVAIFVIVGWFMIDPFTNFLIEMIINLFI